MNTTQKIIKYLAIGFAFSLIIGIISCISTCIFGISIFFNNDDNILENAEETTIKEDIDSIEVNLGATNLYIVEGEEFKAETNNKNIKVTERRNTLFIKEKKHSFSSFTETPTLTIYLPTSYELKKSIIENGAGKIKIENLNTKILDLELGAGSTEIINLTVQNEADIDGGAGKLEILNSEINNLDIDMGAGKLSLESKLTGDNNIEAGVGSVDLRLLGTKEDYKFKVEKGLGSIKIDGENIANESIYGNGSSYIDIEGGVGSINIEFK